MTNFPSKPRREGADMVEVPGRDAYTLYNLVQALPARGVLRSGLRTTLAKLAQVQGKHEYGFLGSDKLGKALGLSHTPVAKHIHDLVALGLIERHEMHYEWHTVLRIMGMPEAAIQRSQGAVTARPMLTAMRCAGAGFSTRQIRERRQE
jgi:biotin operon repressor